jgi:methyl-accepting chemotaxis protein
MPSKQANFKFICLLIDSLSVNNLFALNAAISLARVGKQGKGFAVVADADEVRSLAGRPKTSTQNISNLIYNLQIDVNKAVETLDANKNSITNTIDKTSTSFEKLSQTKASIEIMSESIEQVAIAAEKQELVEEDIKIRLLSI